MRSLFVFVIALIVYGCNSNNTETSNKKPKVIDSITKKISFDYTATHYIETRFDGSKLLIVKADARLTNQNTDTVYFLSFYCNGGAELLQYDTSKFYTYFTHGCFAEIPYIEKIAPNGNLQIQDNFVNKTNESNIRLCIQFFRVDKSFKLNDTLSAREAFNLIDKNGDLLCGPDKIIQSN